jgi:hypothetical protein
MQAIRHKWDDAGDSPNRITIFGAIQEGQKRKDVFPQKMQGQFIQAMVILRPTVSRFYYSADSVQDATLSDG